jgi:hypothetical protein
MVVCNMVVCNMVVCNMVVCNMVVCNMVVCNMVVCNMVAQTEGGTQTEVFENRVLRSTPRMCPYFGVVVGLVWSHDPKSYAGGSLCY